MSETKICLCVRNKHERVITFYLEPWGEEYPMDPGEAFEMVFCSPAVGMPESEFGDDFVSVHGWTEATVRLFQGTLTPWTPDPVTYARILQEESLRNGDNWLSNEDFCGGTGLENAVTEAQVIADEASFRDGFEPKSALRAHALILANLACRLPSSNESNRFLWRTHARMLELHQLRIELWPGCSEELLHTSVDSDADSPDLLYSWLHDHVVEFAELLRSETPADRSARRAR